MKIRVIALLAILVAGCQAGPPVRLADLPGEDRVRAADIVQISVSDAVKTRIEDEYFGKSAAVGKVKYVTGDVWARVFIGTGETVFNLTRSELRYTSEGLGFAGRYTYTVEGELIHAGQSYPINASGSRGFAMNFDSAMRQAVELGVVDAAAKCRAIIESREN